MPLCVYLSPGAVRVEDALINNHVGVAGNNTLALIFLLHFNFPLHSSLHSILYNGCCLQNANVTNHTEEFEGWEIKSAKPNVPFLSLSIFLMEESIFAPSSTR